MLSVEVKINGKVVIYRHAVRNEPLRDRPHSSPWYEYITDDGIKIYHNYNEGAEGLAIQLLQMALHDRRASERRGGERINDI